MKRRGGEVEAEEEEGRTNKPTREKTMRKRQRSCRGGRGDGSGGSSIAKGRSRGGGEKKERGYRTGKVAGGGSGGVRGGGGDGVDEAEGEDVGGRRLEGRRRRRRRR